MIGLGQGMDLSSVPIMKLDLRQDHFTGIHEMAVLAQPAFLTGMISFEAMQFQLPVWDLTSQL
jgi:hypothetical protein